MRLATFPLAEPDYDAKRPLDLSALRRRPGRLRPGTWRGTRRPVGRQVDPGPPGAARQRRPDLRRAGHLLPRPHPALRRGSAEFGHRTEPAGAGRCGGGGCGAQRRATCWAPCTASPCSSRTTLPRAAACTPRPARMPSRTGSPHGTPSSSSSCREAGALIFGKANLSEWANYMDPCMPSGFSVVGGQTRNPYGPHETYGSSSGSASRWAPTSPPSPSAPRPPAR